MTRIAESPLPVRIIDHCWIPLADGCRLAARIWLPEEAKNERVPAVLEYIPYRKNDGTALRDAPMHGYFAGHGYAAVRVDIRGSGDSDGILEDEYLPLEQTDGLQVLRWLAMQPWCDGAVGIIGKSWGGFNGLQIAACAPPELRAVISVDSTDDRYADDVHYLGGAVQAYDMLSWASVMLAYNARPPDPAVVGAGWREKWLERLENTPPHVDAWLSHQRRDAYWKHGSVCEDYGAIHCPVYMVGGWADGYTNAVLRFLEGYPGPSKGLIGPWGHTYPHDGAPGPAMGFLQEAVRWWDRWLKGVDNGIMDEPRLRVWSQEAVRPGPRTGDRPGRWVGEPGWPTPRVTPTTFHLAYPSSLGVDPGRPGQIACGARGAVVADSGPWCGWGGPLDHPADQAPEDGRSACFTSEPLGAPLEVLGFPRVRLAVTADVEQAVMIVRLCDVWPDGASTLVTRGVLNLTHRDGHEKPKPLVSGRSYSVELRLNATSYTVPAGHRIRLAVSPVYWPIVWPSPKLATLTVSTGPSSMLELPVRSSSPDEAVPPHFFVPQAAPAPSHVLLGATDTEERSHTRDARRGITRIIAELSHFPHTRFLDTGLEYDERSRDVYEIQDDDPTSALAVSERTLSITRGDWRTRVQTRSTLSATPTEFLVTNAVDAYEGERRVFAKTWSREIPRDGC